MNNILQALECWAIVHILCTMDETGRTDMGPTAHYLVDRLIRTNPQGRRRARVYRELATRADILSKKDAVSARDMEVHVRRAITVLEREVIRDADGEMPDHNMGLSAAGKGFTSDTEEEHYAWRREFYSNQG